VTSAQPEDALTAVDRRLLRDPVWREETREILRLQEKLKRLTGPEAWQVYLELEEAVNRRLSRGLEVALRRARR